jgi:hypothetical protein
MTHTPGPWKTIGETMIYGPDDYCVAVTRSDHWASCRDIDECLANARLIAAAPDLLAALELAQTQIVNHCDVGVDEWIACTKAISAAIARAKGQS